MTHAYHVRVEADQETVTQRINEVVATWPQIFYEPPTIIGQEDGRTDVEFRTVPEEASVADIVNQLQVDFGESLKFAQVHDCYHDEEKPRPCGTWRDAIEEVAMT